MAPLSIAANDLSVETSVEDALSSYHFGSEAAEHFFCNKCGIYTFHETHREPGQFRVNVGCLDNVDARALEITVFDDASL